MLGGIGDAMVPTIARVRRRWAETANTWTLEIEPDGSAGDWAFLPGQFNMLYVFGIGEVAVSLSGDPARTERLIHTVRAVGAVTRGIARLTRGDSIGLRGPFGTAWPLEESAGADVVIIAGGLGLAPLRPALYRLLAARGRYGRIVLLYGTRSPDDVLYRAELDAWRRSGAITVAITVDHAGGDWHGHVGVVTTLLSRSLFDPSSAVALICGPEIMMRFAIAACKNAGLDERAIYVSMERNMKCAIAQCGHCQLGPTFVCKDGPVFRCDRISGLLAVREL